MVSKCANTNCGAAFRYWSEGKLYRIDLSQDPAPAGEPSSDEFRSPAPRKVEFFWLCPDCARQMALVPDPSLSAKFRLVLKRRPPVPARSVKVLAA